MGEGGGGASTFAMAAPPGAGSPDRGKAAGVSRAVAAGVGEATVGDGATPGGLIGAIEAVFTGGDVGSLMGVCRSASLDWSTSGKSDCAHPLSIGATSAIDSRPTRTNQDALSCTAISRSETEKQTIDIVVYPYGVKSCPSSVFLYGAQPSPHFSHERKRLSQCFVLIYIFAKSQHEWPEAGFRHVWDQFVEHAALPEQRMGSVFGRVDLQMTVHAEAFASGAEQRQENDGEGVQKKKPVAPLRIGDAKNA
jgi:hypothetical protein